ncbi:radical SAM/SPASM domain-containing protein [Raoultibacter phocaeensis]|uniref:radical SAM/SPASM domain-containing protein n=1 Tax=Raoultibacter phocaeensis TaxID=2479841 RepID=UPI0015D5CEB7|nr:radical SAM protein [Raoultibacter phocaeensis]
MPKYILDPKYALRGWVDRPYALRDLATGGTVAIEESVFHALGFCTGGIDSDSALVLPAHRNIIEMLARNGIVRLAAPSETISDRQRYAKADMRMVGKALWSITGLCNLRCRHCYLSAPQGKYGELSLEECLDIVRQLAEANIGLVCLTGGEPLVRDDLPALLDALSEADIRLHQIYTNGVLVTQEFLDDIRRRGERPEFCLSFDGLGWHDWLRGVPGAEKAAVEAIDLIIENGFEVGVEMAVHKKSLPAVWPSILFLSEHGVKSCKVSPCSDSGNWIAQAGEYHLTAAELMGAWLDVISEFLRSGSPLDLMLGGFFACNAGSRACTVPLKRFGGREDALDSPLCGCANQVMYISADGRLLPCIPLSGLSFQQSMPDLVSMPLKEALSAPMYAQSVDTTLREFADKNEACRTCDQFLFCGGGCRASALIAENDYFASDPAACTFFKEGFERKLSHMIELNGGTLLE